MTLDKNKLEAKAAIYCQRHHSSISRVLGFGTQGIVFKTSHNTALKVHSRNEAYLRERSVYERLRSRDIELVQDMQIPRIVTWEDDLNSFEMSIVHVPCVLDFGGAYLDRAPDHFQRDEAWEKETSETFGANWEAAQSVLRELEYRADIWIADVNPGNIKFASPG